MKKLPVDLKASIEGRVPETKRPSNEKRLPQDLKKSIEEKKRPSNETKRLPVELMKSIESLASGAFFFGSRSAPPSVPLPTSEHVERRKSTSRRESTNQGRLVKPLPFHVLEELWTALRGGGLDEEGIFRLAPDMALCNTLVGEYQETGAPADGTPSDPIMLAHIIKIWFRSQTSKVLSAMETSDVLSCRTGEECMALVDGLPQEPREMLQWILRMMEEVVAHQSTNKINELAMVVVMVPNLFDMPSCSAIEQMVSCRA